MRPEGLDKLKKFNYLIGNRTRDLPDCGTAPQPLRYRVPRARRLMNDRLESMLWSIQELDGMVWVGRNSQVKVKVRVKSMSDRRFQLGRSVIA
jgi:hypothetical protein